MPCYCAETSTRNCPEHGQGADVVGEREDAWTYTEESAGNACPFGHPWDVMKRLATAEAQVEVYREALEWLRYALGGWEAFRPVRATNEFQDVLKRIDVALGEKP